MIKQSAYVLKSIEEPFLYIVCSAKTAAYHRHTPLATRVEIEMFEGVHHGDFGLKVPVIPMISASRADDFGLTRRSSHFLYSGKGVREVCCGFGLTLYYI